MGKSKQHTSSHTEHEVLESQAESDTNVLRLETIIRQMMTREDELTNQRMLWMAAFNGLLFAAMGFAWDKSGAKFLSTVFSSLGFMTSFLNGMALVFASSAQRKLLFLWIEKRPKNYDGPGIMGLEPIDQKRLLSMFFSPWILLAFTFSVGWLAILWYVLTKVQ